MPILTDIHARFKFRTWPGVRLAMILLFVGASVCAQNPTEFQLKAVFIYNFVNFVEWPAATFDHPTDPFVIGVAGRNVFGSSLNEAIAGETYRGRPIEVRYIETADQARDCHIVYIEKTCGIFDQVLASTTEKAILTIADTDDFMQKGGVIRFYLERNQLRMEINQQAANDHGLLISGKLLRLASVYNN